MAVKKSKRIFGMTPGQFSILAALGVFWIIAMAGFGIYITRDSVAKTPTSAPALSLVEQPTLTLIPSQVSAPKSAGTRTPIPQPTRRATITPEPSKVPYRPLPTLVLVPRNTEVVQASQPQPQPAPEVVRQDICDDPSVAYNKNIHQISLNYLTNNYNNWKSYYQNILNTAAQDRDALTIVQTQRQLEALTNQYNNNVAAEVAAFEDAVPAKCR